MEGNRLLHREKCSKCGKCTKVCCSGALVMAGKMMTVEEIVAEVEKDRPFYKNSGGGVTFSGGEPLLQKDFLKALLAECKSRGIHTAVESAINVPWKWLEEIQPYVDLFLVDVKLIDEEKHKQVTGVSNARILENLVKLAEAVCELWIRVPVIPEVNDNIEEIGKIAELVKGLKKVKLIELVPFHGMAKGKYESLGMDYKAADYNPPTDDLMNKLNSILKVKGFTAV